METLRNRNVAYRERKMRTNFFGTNFLNSQRKFPGQLAFQPGSDILIVQLANNTRERKMRTKFFGTNFLTSLRNPGHPSKIPGTSQIPLFETQGRQTCEGGHELFDPLPFVWKTATPPGALRPRS